MARAKAGARQHMVTLEARLSADPAAGDVRQEMDIHEEPVQPPVVAFSNLRGAGDGQ
ncbi:hypothetical protein MJ579_13505 [Klebsiella pneumoniae]|nr:hypothetical protein MJ579_13505 [Klebsiella pneumoniae]